jgi:hypothetical protein
MTRWEKFERVVLLVFLIGVLLMDVYVWRP